MAYISVIEPNEASGKLASIYDDIQRQRGNIAEVIKIQSLHPESIVAHMQLYMTIMFAQSPLSRAEREMMAVAVSLANGCVYCQEHHKSALLKYWRDEDRLSKFMKNPLTTHSNVREEALAQFAIDLTLYPDDFSTENRTIKLLEAGLDDRSILDATLVVSYFNFVNRMVLALGVQLEKTGGEGYHY